MSGKVIAEGRGLVNGQEHLKEGFKKGHIRWKIETCQVLMQHWKHFICFIWVLGFGVGGALIHKQNNILKIPSRSQKTTFCWFYSVFYVIKQNMEIQILYKERIR